MNRENRETGEREIENRRPVNRENRETGEREIENRRPVNREDRETGGPEERETGDDRVGRN